MIEGFSALPSVATTRVEPSLGDIERQLSSASPKEAAQKMEALFATLLVRELRRALPDGFFGKGAGADTFEGWFDQHLGQSLADSNALGLAGQIKTSLETKLAGERAAAEAAGRETETESETAHRRAEGSS